MPLQPAVISAPFGNYVQPVGATATLGTFTAAARPGRVWRVMRTVRYYRRLGAWVNRIGLRNPGIDWLVRRVERGRVDPGDKLVSIHGFEEDDWRKLLAAVGGLGVLGVELNMSCPNVGEVSWPVDLFGSAVAELGDSKVVVKLPPVRWEAMAEAAVEGGVKMFHACNTLPVSGGGMSGRPLKPVSLRVVGELRSKYRDTITIIGGGGVYEPEDVDEYADAGADHVAIGTKAMHPRVLMSHRSLRPILERAAARLQSRDRRSRSG